MDQEWNCNQFRSRKLRESGTSSLIRNYLVAIMSILVFPVCNLVLQSRGNVSFCLIQGQFAEFISCFVVAIFGLSYIVLTSFIGLDIKFLVYIVFFAFFG